jgi:hypothetical protein
MAESAIYQHPISLLSGFVFEANHLSALMLPRNYFDCQGDLNLHQLGSTKSFIVGSN